MFAASRQMQNRPIPESVLQDLKLRISSPDDPATAFSIKEYSGLTRTPRDRHQVSDDWISEMCHILISTDNEIADLDLQGAHLSTDGTNSICELLRQSTTITSLDLSSNRLAQPDKLRLLVDALGSNTTLTSLNLYGNPMMNPSWLISNDRILGDNTSVTELNIAASGVTEIEELCRALEVNTRLRSLDLGSSPLYDLGNDFARIFRENDTLTKLDLDYCHIGSEGVTNVCDALKANTTLRVLALSGNGIKDERSGIVADMLRLNTSITDVRLATNVLGDAGAANICKALMGNERVASLDLHANKISSASGPNFFDLLVTSTRLEKLDLDYNKTKVIEQDNRIEEFSLTSSEDFTAWICEALIFAPRQEKIQFGRFQLCTVAEELGLPEGSSKWSNDEIQSHLWETRGHRMMAFAMGLDARLGESSSVHVLNFECVHSIVRVSRRGMLRDKVRDHVEKSRFKSS